MRAGLAVVVCGLLVLVGCGGGSPVVSTVQQPISPLSDVALTGVVSSGVQPIVGAHVYLLAAGTSGYGQASVSVVSAAETGTSDSVGAYVLTNANGGFSLTGDYACTSGQQLYLYALGGNTGSGVNSAAGLMAAIGSCPSSSSPAIFAAVNEVSTIAAAYAFAGFATDATHVSSSGTALAQVGAANAFANAGNLATLGTGVAPATTAAGSGTVPQAEINTLADILAACVQTNGPGTNGCALLLSNAMAGGSTGAAPTDTATAAINIAHNPGANVASLFGLASAVFTPKLGAQPNDFTVILNFTGGGLFEPNSIAIDGSGNAWIADFNANLVTKFSSSGAILSGTGFTGGGMNNSDAIAIDSSGNAWLANGNGTVTELSSSGAVLSGVAGYTGGGLQDPWGIAIDGSGNVWLTNHSGNNIAEISSSGTPLSGPNGFTGGGLHDSVIVAIDSSGDAWVANIGGKNVVELSSAGAVLSGANGYASGSTPYSIAIDGSGNAWVASFYLSSSVIKLSSAGVVLSGANGYAGGGLNTPDSIAVDGAGNVWVANFNGGSVSEFSNAGAALSPSTGFMGGALHTSVAIAVDGSGDVWVTNQQYSTVSELIGGGTPVVTPLAVGVKNNMLGTRP